MFSNEIRKLLFEVISSWQVIAVSVVLIIYISIVNYIARIYNRNSRKTFLPKVKKSAPEEPISTDYDDLGLEDDKKKKK